MSQATIPVHLGERSYEIVVTSGDLGGIGPFARRQAKGERALVVTDEHVAEHASTVVESLCQAGFATVSAALRSGEEQKTLESAAGLYDRLADLPADRNTLVVAVGGGVVGDLAGFVAATFARGLRWLVVPTSLLAMVDSSVGGKVGVNHSRAKNLIGAFHQPAGVWIDVSVLETLPEREYRSGLAEVVKYGVILDPELFEYLERHAAGLLEREPTAVTHVVARSCRLKASVVEQDELERTGARAILNYGHTFAHAFETVCGYGTWLHGEAVAAGMVCASRLAERLGLIDSESTQRQIDLLARLGLPTVPPAADAAAILSVMHRDKKTVAGRLRLVLPRRLGEVFLIDGVDEELVRSVLEVVRGTS